jgi:hypothetical protein
MKKSESTITTIVGMRRCGKSTLTHALANQSKFSRKIVFDMVAEWEGNFIYVESFDEFANIWRENFHKSSYTIIVRFPFGQDAGSVIKLETDIVKLVYVTGKDSELETCLVFEESQFYFPNSGLHPINMHLLTTGRHAHINIIANSQRPAGISKLLISQSEDIYIGRLFEANDMNYLYESVGELAYQARDLKQLEFIHYPVGRPEDIATICL